MNLKSKIAGDLNLGFPLLMAPMFLVSNEAMLTAAIRSGIGACFPSLNYRDLDELRILIRKLHGVSSESMGNFGVNLIVQKTNPAYKKHLAVCVEEKVPFYITSLGNPEEVIRMARGYGAKVYCDVTNLVHAEKVYKAGCDGFVAVSSGAGGHAGANPLNVLVPALRKKFPDKPVLAAGGIADGHGVVSALALGADAVYVGTPFIASQEATVSDAYKNAIVTSRMDDIVMTERLSGTPCAVINTPFAKKLGYRQNWFEKWLSGNARTRRYFKMLVQYRGLKQLEKAVKPGNYNNLWTAGKSVELVNEIRSVKEIVETLKDETKEAYKELEGRFSA